MYIFYLVQSVRSNIVETGPYSSKKADATQKSTVNSSLTLVSSRAAVAIILFDPHCTKKCYIHSVISTIPRMYEVCIYSCIYIGCCPLMFHPEMVVLVYSSLRCRRDGDSSSSSSRFRSSTIRSKLLYCTPSCTRCTPASQSTSSFHSPSSSHFPRRGYLPLGPAAIIVSESLAQTHQIIITATRKILNTRPGEPNQ